MLCPIVLYKEYVKRTLELLMRKKYYQTCDYLFNYIVFEEI